MNGIQNGKGKRGAIILMFMLVFTILMIMLAFALDIGYILATRSELQHAADSAALAAVFKLQEGDAETRDLAEEYAGYNKAADAASLTIDRNDANEITGGVVIGYIENPLDLSDPLQTEGIPYPNSVQVTTSRTEELNGVLDLFVGLFTGLESIETSTRATATIDNRVFGFEAPGGGVNSGLLPFTLYEGAWYEGVNGMSGTYPEGDEAYSSWVARMNVWFGEENVYICPPEAPVDTWTYNEQTNTVDSGPDGIPEVKLYPNPKGISCPPWLPGNFGTLDIGSDNNSTADIVRQILTGPTQEELEMVGYFADMQDGEGVGFDHITLNGDTGVSAAVKNAFEQIIGETRIIPLFRATNGAQGNNVDYYVVDWVGVRIMDVNMKGSLFTKHITVQPADHLEPGGKFNFQAPPPQYGNVYVYGLTR